MPHHSFQLLSELARWQDIIDNAEFTVVSGNGEVYTLYRVVRITHSATDHPEGWTHLANVSRVRSDAMGVAHLRVENRHIVDSMVTVISPPEG